jgi:hypothetical protein
VTLNEGEYTIAPSANRGRVHYVVAYNPGSSPLDFTLTAKKRGTAAGSTC